jgi:tetratricopeptide (TPR) repeat protein
MSDKIRTNFGGYVLKDGRCVSIEDADALYREIVANEDDRGKVQGILRALVVECLDKGLLKAALSYLEKEFSITDDPQGRARIHLAAGLIFERAGDYRSATECYKEAFALPREKDRTWYFLHNNLGYCLNQLGRHDEAERLCRDAIEIDPDSYNAYKNLGVALQGQGKFPEAAVLFLRAALIYPPDPRSLGHLEDLLLNHREEVEGEIPDIADHLAAAIDARKKLMQ